MDTVLHIPHASREVPADVRDQILLSDEELDRELLAMTDAHTDGLFRAVVPGAHEVVFPVSRLVVDPERFVDDAAEPMSRVGMGVVYATTSQGKPLRRLLRDGERASLLERYYEPHHAALTRAVAAALDSSGYCVVVDCHSFPSGPLPYELDVSNSLTGPGLGRTSFFSSQCSRHEDWCQTSTGRYSERLRFPVRPSSPNIYSGLAGRLACSSMRWTKSCRSSSVVGRRSESSGRSACCTKVDR